LADIDRASDAVLVIGLGKFGGATATALARLGHEVLAVDDNAEVVQEWSGTLTHVIEVDSTNLEAMRQIGADDFAMAVVAIGNDIEASILSTLVLEELGVKEIWAKAITPAHGRILERIGADHVVYPERAMGERVAHLLTGKMIDFIEFDDGFAIAKTHAPREAYDKTLGEVKLRSKYGVTVIGVKTAGADFVHAVPDTHVHRGDLLIVSGRTDLVEKFSAIT
jgi:trk system potassium uptake protein TrkA